MKNRNSNHSSNNYWLTSLNNSGANGSPQSDQESYIITRVVGVTFENRQEIVAKLAVGEQIVLRREPTNPYDTNAIRVERYSCEQIGYIDRHKAASLAPLFDDCGGIGTGIVVQVIGGQSNGMSLGVIIQFPIPQVPLNRNGGYGYA